MPTKKNMMKKNLENLHLKERINYVLGDYVAAKLGFDEGENAVKMVVTKDYKGMLLFAFENGKAAKVPLESYATKTNRKKLTGAYSDKSPLVGLLYMPETGRTQFFLLLRGDIQYRGPAEKHPCQRPGNPV